MSKVRIVLTVDYEIFGNGSGDVRRCLVGPTEKLLEIVDKYNVPITLMVEICEYWAFKKEEQKGNLPRGYTPTRWIEEQLIKCIKTDHDIQLHIHPQWLNFSYDSDKNRWKVDFTHWRVSSLSYEEIYRILRKGKQNLESLLRSFKRDYECFVFRAGAWSIQPTKHVLKALINAGFKVDTTVASNCYFKSQLTYFDFRAVPQSPFWFVREDLKKETTNGILEIPICTKKYSFFNKVYYKLLREIKNVKTNPKNCNGFAEGSPKKFSIREFLPTYNMFDFCGMSDNEMIAVLENTEKKFKGNSLIPVVVIGHSKSFNNADNFDSFIKRALDKDYKFVTFKYIVDQIIRRLSK